MLKLSTIILTVMLVFATVYSVMTIAAPKLVIGSSFQALTGKTLDSIQDEGYLKALLNTGRHLGSFALASTIAGFFFLFAGFRNAQLWAWWGMLVVGGLSWGWGLVNNAIMGSTFNIIMHAVGTAVYLLGLLLPIGAFFAKKT
jgi:hypothetical protein